MKLSIVVPCYNEEAVVRETARRLLDLADGWVSRGLIAAYEIIFVNDGSKDRTLALLKEMAKDNSHVKVISFSNNFGHQAALTAGLHNAGGDAAVTLDADLQDPPEVIEEMLEKHRQGFHIVYGVRRNRNEDSAFKRFTALGFYRLMRMMGVKVIVNHADFRLLSRSVLEEFKSFREVNRFLRGLIPLMGFAQATVEYDRDRRFAGSTKYPLRRMLSFALDGITSFSSVPLRMASVCGLVIFAVSLCLGVWVLAVRVAGDSVPGWASTVLPIYFLGGIQLMFFGILGEYLGKIYMEVKRRPLFIIQEKWNFES
ncbi:MAG: glycosyltransferase family 2 protein [Syntrophobacteraceae bacterium]|nr:glycosyltransferase family 2 protein [Syntrophobacteraceae bacterium]